MSPRLDCRARASNAQGHDVGLHPARDRLCVAPTAQLSAVVTTCNQIEQYLQPDQTPTTSVLTSGRSRSKGCVVHESRKLALVLRPLAPHSTFVRSESATGTHPSAPAASKRDAMGLDVSWKGWAALATFALQNGLAILLVRYSKLHDRPYSSQVAVLLGLGLGSQVAIDRYMGRRIFSVHRAPVS